MGLNLGQDWEFQPDAPNNRLFAEYGPTGSSVSFGEDGDLTLDDGNLDLSGGSLTDSSQDYVDLSGGRNDLRLATGQAIEDGSGTERLSIDSIATRLRNDSGEIVLNAPSGGISGLRAYSEGFRLFDAEGGFDAVQYDTDPSVGVLRTPNAGIRVNAEPNITSGSGLILSHDDPNGKIKALNNGGISTMEYIAALHDFSQNFANLRLATGGSIEDGGGTERITFNVGNTILKDENGRRAINLDADVVGYRLSAYNGTPWIIRDREGIFNAVEYTTSASAPGTLELTNAFPIFNGGRSFGGVNNVASSFQPASSTTSLSINFVNNNGKHIYIRNNNGQLEGEDGDGNKTTLT